MAVACRWSDAITVGMVRYRCGGASDKTSELMVSAATKATLASTVAPSLDGADIDFRQSLLRRLFDFQRKVACVMTLA
jgi:Fe-S cluster assembly iron-binding protein IscA